MNAWQMAQQMRRRLQIVRWTAGSAQVVFGTRGVSTFTGTPKEDDIPPSFPWAMVGVGSGTPDDEHPDLIEEQIRVFTAVEVAGDPLGEHAFSGGAVADLGRSAGRGIGEVVERTRAALQGLSGVDGAPLLLTASSSDSPTELGRGRHLVLDQRVFSAMCTSQPHFEAPQQIRHRGSRWTWLGTRCSRRFDFSGFRLVRKVGEIPSSTPDDGTLIYTGTDPWFDDVATSGNTYTAFCDYSSRRNSVLDGTSSPVVGSYMVVT